MGVAVQAALKGLLSEKHLYQSVKVSLDPVAALLAQINRDIARAEPNQSSTSPDWPTTIEEIRTSSTSCANIPWVMGMSDVKGAYSDMVIVPLPYINTACAVCKSRQPFNPMPDLSSARTLLGYDRDQWYSLTYQCQGCHGFPVRFLVRRERLKLTLSGRDPLEVLPVPNALPDRVSEYYGQAVVAYHAGYTLAGIFLLRTFIEQYWRQCVPEVQALFKPQPRPPGEKKQPGVPEGDPPRATGEAQGNVYQATLPVLFRGQFPSLSDLYGRLSAAMHEAKADAALCEDCIAQVLEHFEARRLFKL